MASDLKSRLLACQKCSLCTNGFPVHGEGPDKAIIMVVGEAPGKDEHTSGKPFIGKAGKELNSLLTLAGIKRENVYITNSVKHWPGQGNPAPKAEYIKACREYLEEEIRDVDPDCIIALGATAIHNLLGKLDIRKYHGIGIMRVIEGRERLVYPMYHPAAGMHKPELVPIIKHDFAKMAGAPIARAPYINISGTHGSILAFDVETTGLDHKTDKMICLSTADEHGNASVSWMHGQPDYDGSIYFHVGTIAGVEYSEHSRLAAHNAQFDVQFINDSGMGPKLNTDNVFDTMISASILGRADLRLKSRGLHELGIDMRTFEEVTNGTKDITKAPVDEVRDYVAADAVVTAKLAERDIAELKRNNATELMEIETKLSGVLLEMSRRGVPVDRGRLQAVGADLVSQMDLKLLEIKNLVGDVNPNSPDQLSDLLFKKLNLRPLHMTKSKSRFAVDEETLKTLNHPVIPLLREYKKLQKTKSTYIDGIESRLDSSDLIHTTFRQVGTDTGRMSSADPNMQNIPSRGANGKLLRGLFVPPSPDYCLLSIDYSQIELRVAAAMSGDTIMCRIFNDDSLDIHSHTLEHILHSTNPDDRRIAKNINFGMLYRLSAMGLQRYLANIADPPVIVSMQEAESIRQGFLYQYKELMAWQDRIIKGMYEDGYVSTALNRRRYFPYLPYANGYAAEDMVKAGINMPVQGTAADILKKVMAKVGNMSGIGECMRIQVHDELVFIVRKNYLDWLAQEVSDIMVQEAEAILGIKIKVEMKVGDSWGTMKPYSM